MRDSLAQTPQHHKQIKLFYSCMQPFKLKALEPSKWCIWMCLILSKSISRVLPPVNGYLFVRTLLVTHISHSLSRSMCVNVCWLLFVTSIACGHNRKTNTLNSINFIYDILHKINVEHINRGEEAFQRNQSNAMQWRQIRNWFDISFIETKSERKIYTSTAEHVQPVFFLFYFFSLVALLCVLSFAVRWHNKFIFHRPIDSQKGALIIYYVFKQKKNKNRLVFFIDSTCSTIRADEVMMMMMPLQVQNIVVRSNATNKTKQRKSQKCEYSAHRRIC